MSRPSDTNNSPLSLDTIDEDRVRRALGLKTGSSTPHQQRPEQARQRHRFVADGAVPVVMLNRADGETSGLKDRLATAEGALDAERNRHAATRRLLQDAKDANQALQTRFGHTELSHQEALRTERNARHEAEQAVVALRAEIASLKEVAQQTALAAKPRRRIKAAGPIKRPTRDKSEPQPVRWWTPSYRAKQR